MSNKLRAAVTALLQSDRFYAELLFDLVRIDDPKCKSMGVGLRGRETVLVYNSALLEQWTPDEIVKVVKHEVLHLILGHIGRIGAQNGPHHIGNIAADLVVNQMVAGMPKKLKFAGEDGTYVEGETVTLENLKNQFPDLQPGKTFEWYYDMIMEGAEKVPGNMQTADDHDVGDGNPSESDKRFWREKIAGAAERAKRAGQEPTGALREVLNEYLDTSVDWRTALRQFPQDAERHNTTRTRKKRNRRYGFVNPGVRIERKCKLAVGFDLSGSITDEIKDKFSKELAQIAPFAEITVLFFDTQVTAEAVFDENDFSWRVPGGGGTSFAPVIDRALELEVDGLIMLTDGEAFDQYADPGFPVLWGLLEGYTFRETFGQHVVVK
jgi:predicted metal-dependent peptidase